MDRPDIAQPADDADLRRFVPQDRIERTRAFAALLRALLKEER